MIEAKLVHCGQYHRYGDFFRVWELKTDGESKEEVLRYIRENVYKADLPPIPASGAPMFATAANTPTTPLIISAGATRWKRLTADTDTRLKNRSAINRR